MSSKKPIYRKKKVIIPAAIILLLIAIRIALPSIIKDYVNVRIDELEGYSGSVDDVDLNLWRGAYEIEDVLLYKIDGSRKVPFFSTNKIDVSVEWSALFDGSFVGEIVLDSVNVNFVKKGKKSNVEMADTSDWKRTVRDLFPLKINRFAVNNGEVHYRDFNSDPKVNIYLQKLKMSAENLTNSKDLSDSLISSVTASGLALGSGKFDFSAKLDPFAGKPTFDLNAEIKDVDLTKLNDFIKAYGKFDVEKGTFGLYGEFAAANGKFEGYLKPLFENLKVIDLNKDSKQPLQLIWEGIVSGISELFENQPKDRLATQIPFSGAFDDPDIDIWKAIGKVLQNAFLKALIPGIEGSVNMEDVED